MEFGVGDYDFAHAQEMRRARQRLVRNNPDYHGWLSGGMILLAYGLLIAAAIVLGYQWRHSASEDAQTRKAIDALRQSTTQLTASVAALDPTCTTCENSVNTTVSYPTEFADSSVFTIYSSTTEDTARLRFELDQLANGSDITLVSQNRSGVVGYVSNLPTYPSTFFESEFTLVNVDDATKLLMFNLSLISGATTRVLTVPDQSGVIALLDDITAPTSVFIDEELAVQNALDTDKELQFDVSLVVPLDTNVTLVVPDASGTIALRSDLPPLNATFSDAEFAVISNTDPTAQVLFDVSSLVPSSSVSVLTVQAEPLLNGTIAYSDQVDVYVDVTLNSSRSFPHPDFEGATTLLELGATQIQLWGCGGGGGGGGADGSSTSGGGGGSGSAFEKFLIDNVGQLFTALNCTIGQGGAGGAGSTSSPTAGQDGGTTSVVGIPTGSRNGFLELFAYGGGGGQVNGTGGAGAGSGSAATGALAGTAGNEGGLAGGSPGAPGGFRYPWHAGSGGGQSLIYDPAPWHGGGDAGANGGATGGGGGAGGLFGTGGDGGVSLNDNGLPGGVCAGGGGAAFTDSSNVGGSGGDGQIVIRYWLV